MKVTSRFHVVAEDSLLGKRLVLALLILVKAYCSDNNQQDKQHDDECKTAAVTKTAAISTKSTAAKAAVSKQMTHLFPTKSRQKGIKGP